MNSFNAEIDGQVTDIFRALSICDIRNPGVESRNLVWQTTVYFMELATPHTEEVIKLVDKVGDFEWLIQKSPLS
ncbi:hypothetical protein ES288_D01G187700v1 [Gossypium darwinii]|uniref:Uncharacterized protein n=1 Tax=Gossypium darwinii TaxID=34276 RepID=A0A5D2DRI1_GOSDA|nr:hypothetical protein ES288_D01G187700v1 [Gossypium darwinii]